MLQQARRAEESTGRERLVSMAAVEFAATFSCGSTAGPIIDYYSSSSSSASGLRDLAAWGRNGRTVHGTKGMCIGKGLFWMDGLAPRWVARGVAALPELGSLRGSDWLREVVIRQWPSWGSISCE